MISGPIIFGFYSWRRRSRLKREILAENIFHNSWSNADFVVSLCLPSDMCGMRFNVAHSQYTHTTKKTSETEGNSFAHVFFSMIYASVSV